jgi:hypothetical protein
LNENEAGAFEVRGFPRTYAFQKLERGGEKVNGRRRHCTTTA